MNNYEFILADEQSNKVFHMPADTTTKANVKSKMHHNLRDTERTVDMAPMLKHKSLTSAINFIDANYITVMTPEEVLICDGNEVRL